MKEKILALLVAQFQGVRKDGLMQLARTIALQCATEDDAKGFVDKLTKAQVDEFVKEYRADVDKEVSDGNKTFENNLKKKFDLVEKKTIDEPGGNGGKGNQGGEDFKAAVAEAIAAAMKPLQDKLDGYEKGEVAKSRLQSLNDKLASCKDENFKAQSLKDFARMNFNSDDEFNEYLTEKESAIAAANQNMANAALGGQGKPFFAQKNDSGVSKGVAEYVDSQKPDSSENLGGKEV